MLPKIIDLFSGCGGLSLGFQKAGFDIVAGIELMPEACKTISYNLDYRFGRDKTHICGDITEINADVFKDRFGEEGCIVIGGPPCQAYSMAGRGKLKSLGDDRINIKDSRGYLFQDFLRFAYDLNAKAVIMENVPESTNFGEMNIPEIVCDSLENHGYVAYWTILNAADFGVPQIRERVIVIGIKKSIQEMINLPEPTHKSNTDYQTQYQKRLDSFKKNEHFKSPNSTEKANKSWVTVKEALSDLPVLFPTADTKYKLVNLNEEMDYSSEPQNEFQQLMRTWYGEESFASSANAFRNTRKDFPIFEKMKQGDNFTDAAIIADELFEKEAKIFNYLPGSDKYEKLKKQMVPVYDREKFENKWRRLEDNKPSHTLVAHLCKDTYSHIHPTEPRGISVREAARIQSFPDDFFFNCSMGDAYKQIGNAVPPLLSYAVAKSVHVAFEEI